MLGDGRYIGAVGFNVALVDGGAVMTAKLLIVDDDVNTIRLIGDALRDMGQLFFATDGVTAIRAALDTKPDIVLLDAEMPEMDGYEVCAVLKADPATADATIIFVTAFSDIGHEMRALELGAMDFISKPISPPIVRVRVQTQLTLKQQTNALRQRAEDEASERRKAVSREA